MKIDDREGSFDLAEPLQKRGLPVELTRLPYGDVSWLGNGPEGLTSVGVEFKKLPELLSCITTQRFTGHQLLGMQDCYYPWAYLLVEGERRVDSRSGELLIERKPGWWAPAPGKRNGNWMYRDVSHWLSTVRNQGGLHVVETRDRESTLAWLHAEYTWWTSKEWAQHVTISKAHFQPARKPKSGAFELVQAKKPGRLERLYAQLFGWDNAARVIQVFPSLGQALAASDAQWLRIEGIGGEMLRRWRSVS